VQKEIAVTQKGEGGEFEVSRGVSVGSKATTPPLSGPDRKQVVDRFVNQGVFPEDMGSTFLTSNTPVRHIEAYADQVGKGKK
jgi:hypothetical protein